MIIRQVIDFVLTFFLVSPAHEITFEPLFQNHDMMNKPIQSNEPGEGNAELDSVKKLLELKELQTNVLKKIINLNEPADQNECLTQKPKP